jgi:hypothetical protein
MPAGDFTPITTGYNGFTASSGYDFITGRGTPITNLLIPDLVKYGTTTTVVASSVNPSVFSQGVTWTATVTANTPGSGTPTGTATFLDGSTVLATASLSNGSASYHKGTLTVGVHSISVAYSGDANFTASTSGTLSQTVNKDGTTATVVSSVNPAVFGRSVKFTATISAAAPGSGTPTGTVTFLDGATTLGTAKLSSGQASLTENTLAVGGHSITVRYGGNANFKSSTSGTLSQTINKDATTTVVTSSLNPSLSGQTVIFTATVIANAPGSGIPGGKVTFFDGSTTLGIRSLNSGQATFMTSSLSVGQHSITAVYGGSSSYKPSTSGTFAQTVNAAAQVLLTALPTNEGILAIVAWTLRAAVPAFVTAAGMGFQPASTHHLRNSTPPDASQLPSAAAPFLDVLGRLDRLFAEQEDQWQLDAMP